MFLFMCPNNLIFLSFYSFSLFIDDAKLTSASKAHLAQNGLKVHIHPYDDIQTFLSDLYAEGKKTGKTWVGINNL